MPSKEPLSVTHPEITKDWDYSGNFPITPQDVTYGSSKVFLWLCEKGHVYPKSVKAKTKWKSCPTCNEISKKLAILELYALAEERGGKLLSSDIMDMTKPVEWECSEGHKWPARPKDVKNKKSWCKECAGNQKKTIEEMRLVAKRHGGEFVSQEYLGMNVKHLWKCADGHTWPATPTNVIHSGSWCLTCSPFLTENKCRFILEKLLNVTFPKNRQILKPLELDGYSPSLHAAFEYQGEQHYKYHFKFNSKGELIPKIQRTDEEKKHLCEINGIRLLVIPYYEANTDSELLRTLVSLIGTKLGIRVDEDIVSNFSFEDFYMGRSKLNELRALAQAKGGKLLSTEYKNNEGDLLWECAQGHQWLAPPKRIKYSWCGHCAKNVKLTIEEMQQIAKERGGKCLSTTYLNNASPLEWECAIGHKWLASPNQIKQQNTWCPFCSKNKKPTISEIQAVARDLGLDLISSEYKDHITPLKWKCKNGHEFSALYWIVKAGQHSCKYCKKGIENKEKLNKLIQLAESRGGKCLSQAYINNKTPLLWECQSGHQWLASPQDITNKQTWCPKCSKRKK